jgi:dihydrofolate reductase
MGMSKVKIDISVSADGYVAGPDPSMDDPLGRGGEQLHEWVFKLTSWREPHGREGGEGGPSDDVVREHVDSAGATIMGRRMYSGGSGTWEDDPKADGWWGDDPPFSHSIYVLTHHEREPVEKAGGVFYNFVTDGIEAALERAREQAGDQDVAIAGGADAAQQYLNAGLVDEVQLHVVPVMLGGGRRLLDGIDPSVALELDRVVPAPDVTHIRYRVA